MGMMGHLGQMGQMMRRNGNIFQMLPIKKIWEFCQNSGGGFSQIPLFFYKRNCHKMGYMGGRGWGESIPIFLFLLGASFNTEIALAIQFL